MLTFIRNIYGVLLTRGMRGTFVYVCDPALRAYGASALGPAGRG
ncbi:DNA/RNA helicase domain-containing protein [Microbacterium lacticum]